MNFKTNIEYLFNEYTWFLIAQISRSLQFSKENCNASVDVLLHTDLNENLFRKQYFKIIKLVESLQVFWVNGH